MIRQDFGTNDTTARKKKRPVRTLDYPVYWVEAFNEAYQKWVAVDAIVTGTVAKPSKLEPPASYEANTMTYVVAFEDNGIARDVTRRYTKAYNAKTRKLRVEITERGEEWWRKALKVFRRPIHLDRDQVEDAEFAKRDASEGLPNNVQDFKDHPYYALERHLKRHEVIWPKRASGKVTVGKGTLEPVYRRSDVHTVRSADKWYRFGREIKVTRLFVCSTNRS
jgi:xeroderma pigmentosum group C-complementing protein